MATVAPTVVEQIPGGGIMRVVWVLAQADDGADSNYPGWADRNIQIEGTAGTATVTIQGSNNGGANWRTLTDMAGNSLATLGMGVIKMVQENTLQIRPLVVGGDGTTAITVTLIARRR
jgi:hypothetical protein